MSQENPTQEAVEYESYGAKIVFDLPPIYEDIVKAGMNPSPYAIYTYDGKIYNPSGKHLSEEIVEHEKVHISQQGDDPDGWWSKYCLDQYFRIEQEVEGYARQSDVFCQQNKDRNAQFRYLLNLASILSGETYGNVIGRQKAMEMIAERAHTPIGAHRKKRK